MTFQTFLNALSCLDLMQKIKQNGKKSTFISSFQVTLSQSFLPVEAKFYIFSLATFCYQSLFQLFFSTQLNLLGNLSCVSCDQFQDWIDPRPIFHNCEHPRVSRTRQTYCSSYQSTDLPGFNKNSFQFQGFPIWTKNEIQHVSWRLACFVPDIGYIL